MEKIFADTGYFAALLSPNDELHDIAKECEQKYAEWQLITSEFILSELLSLFAKQGDHFRRIAVDLVVSIRTHQGVQVLPATSALFQSGLAHYQSRKDKTHSHVDCTSFCIMEQQKIVKALAHDIDYVQAGFEAVLRNAHP